jgi:hypothetical protein
MNTVEENLKAEEPVDNLGGGTAAPVDGTTTDTTGTPVDGATTDTTATDGQASAPAHESLLQRAEHAVEEVVEKIEEVGEAVIEKVEGLVHHTETTETPAETGTGAEADPAV